jgi:hypothetical protein
MKWEQLVKSQAKDYKIFLVGYKQSLDQLNADKALLLGQHSEATAPQNIRDKIARDRAAWETLWGIDGQKIVAMRTIHQKEMDAFFNSEQQA